MVYVISYIFWHDFRNDFIFWHLHIFIESMLYVLWANYVANIYVALCRKNGVAICSYFFGRVLYSGDWMQSSVVYINLHSVRNDKGLKFRYWWLYNNNMNSVCPFFEVLLSEFFSTDKIYRWISFLVISADPFLENYQVLFLGTFYFLYMLC